MNLNSNITRKIFEGKYPYDMPYQSYLNLLEKGFDLLKDAACSIEAYTDLAELKAIRIALEYRFEMMRQVRKRQLRTIGELHAVLG